VHFPRERREIGQEILLVCVAGKAIQVHDVSPLIPFLSQKPNSRSSFKQFASRRTRCLIADKYDATARIVDMVLQVMYDPSCLAHAAGRNDDVRFRPLRNAHALLKRSYVMDERPAQEIWILGEMPYFSFRQRFRMATVNLGDIGGEWAVDINRQARNL